MNEPKVVDWAEALERRLPTATSGEAALRRRLLDVLLTPSPPDKMTYEEFLAWTDEDTLAEWVDEEAVMYIPASKRHQDIGGFLFETLRAYVRSRRLGVVVQAPFQMKLEHGREPDLLFVAAEHLERLGETYLEGPADLVVEIISPESVGRDRGEKFLEYEAGGVPEYWLIDPQRQQAEFYQLGPDERYHPVFPDEAGRYHAQAVADFWLQISWLWQEPLPSPVRAVAEIAGVDPALVDAFERALRGES
ncbi:MAG: Uma2 family endonuclease [Anaerolineae bacterium]